MALSPAQIVVLKSELINDPKGLGLNALYANGQDQDVANVLNVIRVGGDYQINAEPVHAKDVVKSITLADFNAMTPTDYQKLTILFLMGDIDLSNIVTQTLLGSVFPAGGQTRTNLIALSKRQGCRAEVLFGNGVRISASEVADTRNV